MSLAQGGAVQLDPVEAPVSDDESSFHLLCNAHQVALLRVGTSQYLAQVETRPPWRQGNSYRTCS